MHSCCCIISLPNFFILQNWNFEQQLSMSPLCSSWQPSFYYVSTAPPTLDTSYKWNGTVFVFLNLIISLSIMPSRFIYVVAGLWIPFLFKAAYYSKDMDLLKMSG